MNEINAKEFWDRLSLITFDKDGNKIPQNAYCAMLGFEVHQFRNKKSNNVMPTLEQLVKISNLFDVSLDWLVLGKESESKELELKKEVVFYKNKLDYIREVILNNS